MDPILTTSSKKSPQHINPIRDSFKSLATAVEELCGDADLFHTGLTKQIAIAKLDRDFESIKQLHWDCVALFKNQNRFANDGDLVGNKWRIKELLITITLDLLEHDIAVLSCYDKVVNFVELLGDVYGGCCTEEDYNRATKLIFAPLVALSEKNAKDSKARSILLDAIDVIPFDSGRVNPYSWKKTSPTTIKAYFESLQLAIHSNNVQLAERSTNSLFDYCQEYGDESKFILMLKILAGAIASVKKGLQGNAEMKQWVTKTITEAASKLLALTPPEYAVLVEPIDYNLRTLLTDIGKKRQREEENGLSHQTKNARLMGGESTYPPFLPDEKDIDNRLAVLVEHLFNTDYVKAANAWRELKDFMPLVSEELACKIAGGIKNVFNLFPDPDLVSATLESIAPL